MLPTNHDSLSTIKCRQFTSERQQVGHTDGSEVMIILDCLAERPFHEQYVPTHVQFACPIGDDIW